MSMPSLMLMFRVASSLRASSSALSTWRPMKPLAASGAAGAVGAGGGAGDWLQASRGRWRTGRK
jgi:hypothetical protein